MCLQFANNVSGGIAILVYLIVIHSFILSYLVLTEAWHKGKMNINNQKDFLRVDR